MNTNTETVKLISPLWTELHKTARCKDNRYFSWPHPSPSAAASAPFHLPWTEFSKKEKMSRENILLCIQQTLVDLYSVPVKTVNDHLDRHDLVTWLVHHLVDRPVGPSADLTQIFQIFGCEVPVLLWGDLQLPWWLNAVRSQPLSKGGGGKTKPAK